MLLALKQCSTCMFLALPSYSGMRCWHVTGVQHTALLYLPAFLHLAVRCRAVAAAVGPVAAAACADALSTDKAAALPACFCAYCLTAELSPRLWGLWPQLHALVLDFGIDYWENILIPLDNFISRWVWTQTLCSLACLLDIFPSCLRSCLLACLLACLVVGCGCVLIFAEGSLCHAARHAIRCVHCHVSHVQLSRLFK
jgi:hypothetical protein